jgi:hypothetical protein
MTGNEILYDDRLTKMLADETTVIAPRCAINAFTGDLWADQYGGSE